jgi:hypothetical protein
MLLGIFSFVLLFFNARFSKGLLSVGGDGNDDPVDNSSLTFSSHAKKFYFIFFSKVLTLLAISCLTYSFPR